MSGPNASSSHSATPDDAAIVDNQGGIVTPFQLDETITKVPDNLLGEGNVGETAEIDPNYLKALEEGKLDEFARGAIRPNKIVHMRDGPNSSAFSVLSKVGEGGMGQVLDAVIENRQAVAALIPDMIIAALGGDRMSDIDEREYARLLPLIQHNLDVILEDHGGRVAIKMMYVDADNRNGRQDGEHGDGQQAFKRFVSRELRTTVSAQGKVRNAPRVVGAVYNPDKGVCELQMEFVDGFDVGELMKANGLRPMPFHAAMNSFALTMRYAKDLAGEDIVHRDWKPSNLRATHAGEVIGIDFGLAKKMGNQHEQTFQTHSNAVMGTIGYMSPEQARGEKHISSASDVYSLGLMFTEQLTGRHPMVHWNASGIETLKKRQSEVPPIVYPGFDRLKETEPHVAAFMERELFPKLRKMMAVRSGDRPLLDDELCEWFFHYSGFSGESYRSFMSDEAYHDFSMLGIGLPRQKPTEVNRFKSPKEMLTAFSAAADKMAKGTDRVALEFNASSSVNRIRSTSRSWMLVLAGVAAIFIAGAWYIYNSKSKSLEPVSKDKIGIMEDPPEGAVALLTEPDSVEATTSHQELDPDGPPPDDIVSSGAHIADDVSVTTVDLTQWDHNTYGHFPANGAVAISDGQLFMLGDQLAGLDLVGKRDNGTPVDGIQLFVGMQNERGENANSLPSDNMSFNGMLPDGTTSFNFIVKHCSPDELRKIAELHLGMDPDDIDQTLGSQTFIPILFSDGTKLLLKPEGLYRFEWPSGEQQNFPDLDSAMQDKRAAKLLRNLSQAEVGEIVDSNIPPLSRENAHKHAEECIKEINDRLPSEDSSADLVVHQ